MKKAALTLAIALCSMMPMAAQNPAGRAAMYTGVGPVEKISMEVSSLPENAQTFINELFPATTVASAIDDIADNEYVVKMSDGAEITFDRNGVWKEVEAPDNATLPSSALNRLVPENVVIETLSGDAVTNGGVINYVEEIALIPGFGYVVEYEASPAVKGKVLVSSTGQLLTGADAKAALSKAKKGKCGKMQNVSCGKKHDTNKSCCPKEHKHGKAKCRK